MKMRLRRTNWFGEDASLILNDSCLYQTIEITKSLLLALAVRIKMYAILSTQALRSGHVTRS